jgi:hypothetical protein
MHVVRYLALRVLKPSGGPEHGIDPYEFHSSGIFGLPELRSLIPPARTHRVVALCAGFLYGAIGERVLSSTKSKIAFRRQWQRSL